MTMPPAALFPTVTYFGRDIFAQKMNQKVRNNCGKSSEGCMVAYMVSMYASTYKGRYLPVQVKHLEGAGEFSVTEGV